MLVSDPKNGKWEDKHKQKREQSKQNCFLSYHEMMLIS